MGLTPTCTPELELMSFGGELREERFVLTNGLALVVVDGPAAAHPARIDDRSLVYHRPRVQPESSSESRGQIRRNS